MNNYLSVFITVLSYSLGWVFYFANEEFLLYLILFFFLYINMGKILNHFFFNKSIVKPMIFSLSSVVILMFLEGKNLIIASLIASMILILFGILKDNFLEKNDYKDRLFVIKKILFPIFFPFAINYLTLVLRFSESISKEVLVLFYFTTLYFLSYFFNNVKYVIYFSIIQVAAFIFVVNQYYNLEPVDMGLIFFGVFVFSLISYCRKGLLQYLQNTNS